MNVLVTGATGFVGSHLCRRLLSDGHRVTVLRRASSDVTALEGLGFVHKVGEITDPASVEQAVAGQEAVIHAAAHVAFHGCRKEDQYAVNVQGTRNVAQACRQSGVRRLVHVSSVAAIGITTDPARPADEGFRFNLEGSRLTYHLTKRLAEEAVLAEVANGLDGVIVNPALIFGPRPNAHQGATALEKPLKSRVVTHGPGGRCIVHVTDVVDGIASALERGRAGERYILGGDNVSFREMSEEVCRQLSLTRLHVSIPSILAEYGNKVKSGLGVMFGREPLPAYDRRFCYQFYDSTKARAELGYNARSFASIVEECAARLGWGNGEAKMLGAQIAKSAD